MTAVVAVDVGGTGIKAEVIDGSGNVVNRIERATPVADGPDAVVAAVLDVARATAVSRVVAAAVVVPGSVDVVTGTARYSANIGWRDVPLRELVAAELGVPVMVEHDVRAAGLAECTLGRARGVDDCLIVLIGTGIAGVVVSGGAALRGASDLAGEIGHMCVYPDGEPCACGMRGCLETYASAAAITRRYRALRGTSDGAAMSTRDAALGARDIVQLRATDPLAEQVWLDATDALALALAAYTMVLDPELVVLGGGLAEAGDALLEPVRAALAGRFTWRAAPAVERSALGMRAGRVGGAILAWQRVGRSDFSAWTDRR